jgi:ABC-type multidrug transport system ATPase subunit
LTAAIRQLERLHSEQPAQRGLGVITESLRVGDLERFADNIGMIKNGQLLVEGPTSELMERFKLVDFETENGAVFGPGQGFFLQKHEGNRWQALVDARGTSLDSLLSRGARQITTTPVTLEDVFVALAAETTV